jgi:hypothetical protein
LVPYGLTIPEYGHVAGQLKLTMASRTLEKGYGSYGSEIPYGTCIHGKSLKYTGAAPWHFDTF